MNEQNQRDSIMSMARGAFEADGGIWKLEAKKNIADYFLKNMGDLIDAGKVVVMQ